MTDLQKLFIRRGLITIPILAAHADESADDVADAAHELGVAELFGLEDAERVLDALESDQDDDEDDDDDEDEDDDETSRS